MMDIRDFVIDGAGRRLQAGHLNAEITPAAINLSAGAIEVVPPMPAPFDGAGRGSIRLVTNPPPWPETAASWRAAGGLIELPAVDLQWGPLLLTGAGTGRLDADLQPDAKVTVRIKGAVETLDAAMRAGLIAPAPASAARAVLGLLTLAAHGEPVTLPIVLGNQTLTVAQFPLLRLPSIVWDKP